MERYTYFDGGKWRLKIGDTEYSGDWVERLAAYEETGLEPEELAQAQAKKKGRLVVLPCDVGDKLYDVTLGEVREKIVISLSMLLSKSVNHLVIHAENFRNAVTVPFPVSWTVKMKKKQKETQDILSYHTQAAGCSDKARAKASGGRQPIEECGRTGL